MELTQAEIEERTAILKHLRSLLEKQRAKFQEYLEVLEAQNKAIPQENPELLAAHTDLGQQIADSIVSLQKVILPFEELYHQKVLDTGTEEEIPWLHADLEALQQKVLHQNKINRELLAVHMEQIQQRISDLHNPYKNTKSVYTHSDHIATQISIDV